MYHIRKGNQEAMHREHTENRSDNQKWKEEPCKFDREGRCRFGEECRYQHYNKTKKEHNGEHNGEWSKKERGKDQGRLITVISEKIREEIEKLRQEITVPKNGDGYDGHWERNFWPSNQHQNHQPIYREQYHQL